MSRSGADLALLLLGGFRSLVDAATAELARHGRRMLLQVTPLGFEVLRQGEAIFDELRDQWERQIGPAQLESLEAHLAALAGDPAVRFDTPGWMSRDLGEPA